MLHELVDSLLLERVDAVLDLFVVASELVFVQTVLEFVFGFVGLEQHLHQVVEVGYFVWLAGEERYIAVDLFLVDFECVHLEFVRVVLGGRTLKGGVLVLECVILHGVEWLCFELL